MATAIERIAPYAPGPNVLAVIRKSREGRLADPLTVPELARIGIPESNGPRTIQALKFLGLIDEDGHRSRNYERIRVASTQDYPGVLADILRAAYEDVFAVIDPAKATDIELHDAFRGFKPDSQTNRMVLLFTSLCKEAGLMAGGPPETRTRARKSSHSGKGNHAAPTRPVQSPPPPPYDPVAQPLSTFPPPLTMPYSTPVISDEYYEPLHALLRQLPDSHKWTTKRQRQWLNAVTGAVQWLVEVTD